MSAAATMSEGELDVLGPVDYLVVEFPADKADFSGAMAAELTALVSRRLGVRLVVALCVGEGRKL